MPPERPEATNDVQPTGHLGRSYLALVAGATMGQHRRAEPVTRMLSSLFDPRTVEATHGAFVRDGEVVRSPAVDAPLVAGAGG